MKFIFYGLIQGLTEFIPVSSTAHLKIISLFFGFNDPGYSLSAIIQIGSIFALFWYFRKNILKFFDKSLISSNNKFILKKLFNSVLIGTIPISVVGLIVKLLIPNLFENLFRSNLSIGIVSLLISAFMYFADLSRNKFINLINHKYINSLYIGFAQAIAIIPGVSRSGITISMALMMGWERKDAAKFSFLLGIPAITLGALVEFLSSFNKFSTFSIFPLIIGIISTFFSSLFSIKLLLKYLSLKGLKLFVYYRLIFGILILLNL